jgi:hypothetical protein
MIVAVAVAYLIGYFAIRWERARATARAAANTCSPGPRLQIAEQAALASMALRYAHGDPKPGRDLANYLRTRLPDLPDTEIARCVLALSNVARHYLRVSDGEAAALAAYLYAMGSAALELTELERDEIPR